MRSLRPGIEDLHLEIKGCCSCQLLTGRKFGLSTHGNHHSRIMLVSEAPGKDSIEKGRMWSGASGLKIRKVLHEFKYDLEECIYMTDLVKCLPPCNRKPTRDEILNCREYLRLEIEILYPTVILALGKTALVHLFSLFKYPVGKRLKMKDYHARTDIFVGKRSINLIPLYHPSWENKWAPNYSADLKRIFKEVIAEHLS
jgi:DNA polymerase